MSTVAQNTRRKNDRDLGTNTGTKQSKSGSESGGSSGRVLEDREGREDENRFQSNDFAFLNTFAIDARGGADASRGQIMVVGVGAIAEGEARALIPADAISSQVGTRAILVGIRATRVTFPPAIARDIGDVGRVIRAHEPRPALVLERRQREASAPSSFRLVIRAEAVFAC
jgi:hypothetical protein